MDIIIQSAKPSDAEVLTSIAFTAKRYWRYPESWVSLWAEELRITPQYIKNHKIFFAESDGKIAGLYALSFEDDTWEVDHFWVPPEFMGRGIGKALFNHAVDLIRKNNGHLLKIVSDPNAEGFYLKMGATRIGDFPGKPEGRILPLLQLDI